MRFYTLSHFGWGNLMNDFTESGYLFSIVHSNKFLAKTAFSRIERLRAPVSQTLQAINIDDIAAQSCHLSAKPVRGLGDELIEAPGRL